MKSPPFTCECPSAVDETASLPATRGEDVRPLAGGRSPAPPPDIRRARTVFSCARIAPPLLGIAAILGLAACQGLHTLQLADGDKRPDLPRTENAPDEPIVSSGDESSGEPTTTETTTETTGTGVGPSDNAGQDDDELQDDQSSSESSVVLGTAAGGSRLAELPRNNPTATDLLDHWGHRQSDGIAVGLSLAEPADGADAAGLRRLQTAAQTDDGVPVAPDLQEGDEVRVLGARRGVTYGRWSGGAGRHALDRVRRLARKLAGAQRSRLPRHAGAGRQGVEPPHRRHLVRVGATGRRLQGLLHRRRRSHPGLRRGRRRDQHRPRNRRQGRRPSGENYRLGERGDKTSRFLGAPVRIDRDRQGLFFRMPARSLCSAR